MKKIHIIAIVAIALAVAALSTAAKDVAQYATFDDAHKTTEKVKIVGELLKSRPMIYDPLVDPNRFSFYLKDRNGKEQKVTLLKAKPQDFEKSEQIVCTGSMQASGEFVANDVLLKCPSKYKDEEIYMKQK
jgi:cytochrome c-type biogenesis protein CcmE